MPHYPKAPLTEAIIDIRAPSEANIEAFSGLQLGETDRYPEKAIIAGAFVHFDVQVAPSGVTPNAPAAPVSEQMQQMGVRFTSADKRFVWQSRKTGFTFSRLEPYQNWDSFRDEAKRLWELHRAALKPDQIQRLAVRYVNRIDIPSQQFSLNDYFQTLPEQGKSMPAGLVGFFVQLQFNMQELPGLSAVINQAIVPPAKPGVTSVVLDVDLYRETDVPQQENDIWQFFETLRSWKNRVFEASITDKTRELFR